MKNPAYRSPGRQALVVQADLLPALLLPVWRHIAALMTVLATALTLNSAAIAAPETVAVYKDWIVYSQDLGGDIVCYAITEPTGKAPQSANHGDVFFMIASWQSGIARNQPSFMAGYTLREAPAPLAQIGSDKFRMYSSETESFIASDEEEKRLVTAMRRGAQMRLSATSDRGTATSYTFSLLGISAAIDRATKACS